jgi:hypothetical protein
MTDLNNPFLEPGPVPSPNVPLDDWPADLNPDAERISAEIAEDAQGCAAALGVESFSERLLTLVTSLALNAYQASP